MSDPIIKPSGTSANFKVQNPSGTNKITMDSDGVTTFASNVALSGTMTSGTIGDSVVMTNKYYLNLTAPDAQYGSFSNDMMNNSGTTRPYFNAGVGDTTNIAAVNNHDYKLVRAGIYLIIFTANFYESSSGTERNLGCQIRHNESSPTSSEGTDVLGRGGTQVANTTSGSDYASATAHVVYNFSANHLINFRIYQTSSGYFDSAYASIVLIRPL